MSTADIQSEIRSRITQFARDLDALVRQAAVASISDALAGANERSRPASARSVSGAIAGRARRKGQKRSPEQLEQRTHQLLSQIKKHSGQRIEQIGEALGVPTKELALPAKKLLAEKQIRTTGHKRATKYFPR
jgi:hypothetical protein